MVIINASSKKYIDSPEEHYCSLAESMSPLFKEVIEKGFLIL